VDADPESVLEATEAGEVNDLFIEVGSLLAERCGELSGEGLSGFIVHLAEQQGTRSLFTETVIEGALAGICTSDFGVELNLQAQAACTGFS